MLSLMSLVSWCPGRCPTRVVSSGVLVSLDVGLLAKSFEIRFLYVFCKAELGRGA